ncbi:MAG: alpha/beta hydrolase [Anaerolineae bacterium]|nr:alpha/beta hydrolase [Anaerolineae bacterium]
MNIQHKTLILWSEKDRSAPQSLLDGATDTVPLAQIALIPGAGHWAAQENPDFVNHTLLNFLQAGAAHSSSS